MKRMVNIILLGIAFIQLKKLDNESLYYFWTRNWSPNAANLTDIPHRLTELDFLFFEFDGIYERFKIVALK